MKILLAGEGGQGVQLAAEILTHAAFSEGKEASLIPNFGVEQRGGVSLAFIIIGEDASYPKFDHADVLAVFCDRANARAQRYIGPKTKLIYGPAMTHDEATKPDTPQKVWNMVVLGKIIDLTSVVSKEILVKTLDEKFEKKFKEEPGLRELNLRAIDV
ncbi:MAG: 2-oxoacid:acceptor oxidoreductase family protein [bacterium]|nr:2-oxoacid:acceptor oxidoreductase family protein [bacterium]